MGYSLWGRKESDTTERLTLLLVFTSKYLAQGLAKVSDQYILPLLVELLEFPYFSQWS